MRGPTSLGYKEAGTYNVVVSGGSGDYDYEWFLQYDGSTRWEALHSRNQTQTVTMLGRGFSLRADVYDRVTSLEVSGTFHVDYEGEPPDENLRR